MKNKMVISMTVGWVILAGLVPVAFAQMVQGPPNGFSQMPRLSADERLQHMSEKLRLTEEQKARLRPLLQDHAARVKAIDEDRSLSPEQKKVKRKQVRASVDNKLRPFLTDEQWLKLERSRQIREKMGIE